MCYTLNELVIVWFTSGLAPTFSIAWCPAQGGNGIDMNKIALLQDLVAEPLAKLGLELVDIEYKREAGDRILRIFIDRMGGVDLEACSAASRAVKDLIDDAQVEYDHMEVSSPGLDRVIKTDRDLLRFKGSHQG